MKIKSFILIIGISLFLLVVSFLIFLKTGHLLWPEIDNTEYAQTQMGSQFTIAFLFAAVVALTPILLHLTWRFSKTTAMKEKMISTIIVLACMILAVLLRRRLLIAASNELIGLPTVEGVPVRNSILVEKIHFEYYLLAGLILGCLITYFILRKKNFHQLKENTLL